VHLFGGIGGVLYQAYIERERVAAVVGRVLWATDMQPLYTALDAVRDDPGDDVLDVPSGGGLLLRRLAGARSRRVVCVDVDDAALQRCVRAAPASGMRVETVAADVHRLPFPAASFDVVVAANSLHCFARPRDAAAEMARCLRPGGRLVLTTFARGRARRSDRFMRLLAAEGGFGPGLSEDELRHELGAAGLVVRSWTTSGSLVVVEATRPST
jgi:SAM-dependent methyltransferase